MPDEYSFTGEDIKRVTGGYVNSGLLRMWISEGRLTPGPRAKSGRGGPRTFDTLTIFKVALMAELRKHGVSLLTCQKWADHFIEAIASANHKNDDDVLGLPLTYLIKAGSGTVTPISVNDRSESLHNIIRKYGPTLLIVDIPGILVSVLDVLLPSGGDAAGAEVA